MANIIITRRMKAGNLCVGILLVDLLCLGVKDCFYRFNLPQLEYEEFKVDKLGSHQGGNFIPADYKLVHNIVYEGIAFAEDCGIAPHKDFSIVKYFLAEDDESIEMMEVPLGDDKDGKPVIFSSPQQPNYKYITILENKLGPNGFKLIFIDKEGEHMDDIDEGENEDDKNYN